MGIWMAAVGLQLGVMACGGIGGAVGGKVERNGGPYSR